MQCCNENVDLTSIDSITSLLDLPTADCSSSGNKKNKPSDEVISNLNDIINLSQNTLDTLMDTKTYRAMKLCNVEFMVQNTYDGAIVMCDKITDYINKFYKKIWIGKNCTNNKNAYERQKFAPNVTEAPLEEIDGLISQVLKSVEKLYKKHIDLKTENEDEKLLKCQIVQPLSSDLEDCNLSSINKQLKTILKSSIGDNVLRSCCPLFEQYALLVQFFITQQTMVYRVLSKMNYLLSTLFTDLASNVS